ncbi:chromosome segregation protein [uncultured Clostridium sp.]|uniref:AAA family ATPase n=1 Tax=uncultured Clostridium sp. TaxID=59620 RepID=UPI000820A930|nr:AAA family ATPase [uncultured Clostridium sp.]SCJ90352.1 chromosome segregation protein [uncultured Clostridium sp.]
MIIRKVNIIAFGGLKNKIVEFDNGINVVYGENETGKSTIQAFIKIWLYGFNNSRGKDLKVNERLRYMPSFDEKIKGELFIEFEDKTYIIKRTFGKTKKEDTSVIINSVTGDEVNEINLEEPGKYFLNINRSTFTKTLFINQLGSEINKDKDEEIIDKVLNSVGVSEGDVTVDKAFIKLENYKKQLTNIRKTGYLDKLKEKQSLLLSERYERYNLSEKNLENEEDLLKLKKEREEINNDIEKLESYKKYLKKIKVKREYEEIISYLRKKEQLEKEEEDVRKLLTYNSKEIELDTIDSLKEDYSMYLKVLELKEKNKFKLDSKLEELRKSEEPLEEYKYIEELGEGISKKLLQLKIEQDSLKEKIDINKNIDEAICVLKNKEVSAKEYIGNAYRIKDIKEEVSRQLETYEEKLKSLKFCVENRKDNKLNNKYIKGVLSLLTCILIILALITNSFPIKIVLFTIVAVCIVFVVFNNKLLLLKEKSYISSLKKDIEKIEIKLEKYNRQVGVIDFGQLIRCLKLYDEYLTIKDNIERKIKEKHEQKELLKLEEANKRFNLNREIIDNYLKISKIDNIDTLIDSINRFEEMNKKCTALRYEVRSIEESIGEFDNQMDLKKNEITEKLMKIGLEIENILELEEKLRELKEKLKQKEDISKKLLSIDEAYSALIKDKDLEAIKEEAKEILNIDFKMNYEKEEEVDNAIKIKSNRLIQVEKEAKDLENEVNNLLKNKRSIPEIEDEVILVESDITEEEKNLKAVELAKEMLNKSYSGLRDDFGPVLNRKVMLLFKRFTNDKYSNVLVSDNYEMKVAYKNEILSSKLLSNGANDQLYLALRVAFIEMIFGNKNVTLYLDDAFTQYDDNRIKNILDYLANEKFIQILIFTCQNRERSYLKKKCINHNYISL